MDQYIHSRKLVNPNQRARVTLCTRAGEEVLSEDLSWDFRRGMATAATALEATPAKQPFQVTKHGNFSDGFEEDELSPHPELWSLTEDDPEYYNHYIEMPPGIFGRMIVLPAKRYRWGNYQFDTLDFFNGFRKICELSNADFAPFEEVPLEDTLNK